MAAVTRDSPDNLGFVSQTLNPEITRNLFYSVSCLKGFFARGMFTVEQVMKKICRQRLDYPSVAEEMAGNEDLLREIFLRLPAKSLIKFKAVSRQWSSLISDPKFAWNHSSQTSFSSSTPSGLYFCNSLAKSEEIESVSIDYGPNQPSGVGVPSLSFLNVVSGGAKIKILQSSKGLLLCQLTSQSRGTAVIRYCVCNPTTRKCKMIPWLSLLPTESIVAASLAFDPSESPHYRVVCVKHICPFNYCSGKSHQMHIYSSDTGSWRSSSCNLTLYDSSHFENYFYLDGAIYGIRMGYPGWLFDKFDLNEEKLEFINFPRKLRRNRKLKLRYFGESRGYWHLIYIRSLSSDQFKILEMDRDAFTWSVKYQVYISHLLSAFPEIDCKAEFSDAECRGKGHAFSILSFIRGEREEDSELVLLVPGKVISYKLKHKTVKVLRELPSHHVVDTSSIGFVNAHQFVDTICSV